MKYFILCLLLFSQSSFALWPSKKALSGQFPAALYFKDCSAVKIHDRAILTAAHCVYDNKKLSFLDQLAPKKTLDMHHGLNLEKEADQKFTLIIQDIFVHSSYQAPSNEQSATPLDLAVIVVEPHADFARIQNAKINFSTLPVETKVVFSGYGMKKAPDMYNGNSSGQIPVKGYSEGLSYLGYNFSYISNFNETVMEFEGPGSDLFLGMMDVKPMLGPGDSGGAVYLAKADEVIERDGRTISVYNTVIGINSTANRFNTNSRSVRLDNDNYHHSVEWINSILKPLH